MKSPRNIAERMQRQWQRREFRLEMLTSADAWPKRYAIGQPTAAELGSRASSIREHVIEWQRMNIGEVAWRDINYRASSEPIRLPVQWVLQRPSDWVRGCADRRIIADFGLLEYLISHAEPVLRDVLITHLRLLQGRSREELRKALALAARLNPGEAQGRPLRLLAGHGVDTKFFERNRQLLVRLLDARFDGEVSSQGLHEFLGATPDGEHWLLLTPLQGGLLPFEVQQVRTQELATLSSGVVSAGRVLVVENRQCRHLLPETADTIAILGSGLDLDWLRADWLDGKRIAYWGDIDTWGLSMLARARQLRPDLTSILMDRQTFEQHAAGNAVPEPVGAGPTLPMGLDENEQSLYRWLSDRECGRLEQEFLPAELVLDALQSWTSSGG